MDFRIGVAICESLGFSCPSIFPFAESKVLGESLYIVFEDLKSGKDLEDFVVVWHAGQL